MNNRNNSRWTNAYNPNTDNNINPSYLSSHNNFNSNLNYLSSNQNKDNFLQNNSESNQSESMKKEEELENQIRDHLKCYICLTKVMKPKMCKFCKKICCESCIDKWLLNHDYCGICKHNVTQQDMITLPFLDDMSTYFINNIDSHPKNHPNINNINKEINNNNINSQSLQNKNNLNKKEDKNICPKHKSKIDYYCIQCNKYFCSNCLVFFSDEGQKHKNHLILQIAKMNNLGIREAVNEYKKLPETKNVLDHLIGLINLKIKENEIKKANTTNFMNYIKDLYLKKIDENTGELNKMLVNLKTQKDSIENSINSIPNGFNNIVNSNDYVQGGIVSKELKKMNVIDDNLENEIKEKSKISPKLFVENYETELLEIEIPYAGQYIEGLDFFEHKIDIIPNFPSKLILKYLQGKIYISFCVDIDLPLNAPYYPKFYTYVILKNQKYGVEFINLSNQSFPQDFVMKENRYESRRIRQQTNSNEIEAQQFLFLGGNDKKVRLKAYIIKSFYDY